MQGVSPARDGLNSPLRPAKRQRVSRLQHHPSAAAVALLERVSSIKVCAVELRDDHQSLIDDFDKRASAKRAASRAAAKVSRGPPAEDVQKFALGDISKSQRRQAGTNRKRGIETRPTPAMALLVEQDTPEKAFMENSVIRRALMINRRNAELAKERLPKQPEAQRGKTHWDYVLDETVWLANDYREERKWKIQLAKRVSKMILQFHSQRSIRAERARRDEHQRVVRLAGGVARDVRKFWNQVREVADYRASILRDAELARQRKDQLDYLLQQTEAYTNVLATTLSNAEVNNATKNMPSHDAPQDCEPALLATKDQARSQKRSRTVFEDEQMIARLSVAESGAAGSDCGERLVETSEGDDGATLDAAERPEDRDPKEVEGLSADAEKSLDAILREQGIDLTAYRNDSRSYAESSTDSSEHAAGTMDDCSAMVAEGSHASNPSESLSDIEKKGRNEGDSLQNESGSASVVPGTRTVDHRGTPNMGSIEAAVAEHRRKGASDTEFDTTGEQDGGATVLVSEKSPEVVDRPRSSNSSASCARGRDQSGMHSAPSSSQSPIKAGIRSAPNRLLRGSLRQYQHSGMEWLVTLYDQKLNGILADEMGLGKTIQTISLLAYLALERNIWGPHLVVVPTSVMINWEVEFKKFLPGFKILTYYGSMKERRAKRQGWSKTNAFHVCITSYALVVQDAAALRRKKWEYLILDEAHHIKNFQSQRWQTLLNFPSRRRLLLTGTPLQNSVMELWSLMHFLMPDVFQSHAEFKDWFSKPLAALVSEDANDREASSDVVANLHRVLRPFLLRRLKADVEKGLPGKFEHVLPCPLSKRQRQLYEDFMSRSEIKETLESGDFIGVMNVLMQLRKVCNHPDLFEGRPIVSPFAVRPIFYPVPRCSIISEDPLNHVNLPLLGLDLATEEVMEWPGKGFSLTCTELSASTEIQAALEKVQDDEFVPNLSGTVSQALQVAGRRAAVAKRATLRRNAILSEMRTRRRGMLGADVIAATTMTMAGLLNVVQCRRRGDNYGSAACSPLVPSLEAVASRACAWSDRFGFSTRAAVSSVVDLRYVGDDARRQDEARVLRELSYASDPLRCLFRSCEVRSKVTLPDARLIQWDCGKLQILDSLLRRLKKSGHRVLIFTQMTRMLDILEAFLSMHAHRYLRLDGGTKTEERQRLVERFNTDRRVFCMILATRAGGLGLNLTGADTVVFYDTDYNPSIDAQAQDRAHRIGQTKPVNIYRLVSRQTVEENILKRAHQKRNLESLVISDAGFTTESFRKRLDVMSLVLPEADGVRPVHSSSGGGVDTSKQAPSQIAIEPAAYDRRLLAERLPDQNVEMVAVGVGAEANAETDLSREEVGNDAKCQESVTKADFPEDESCVDISLNGVADRDSPEDENTDVLQSLTAVQRFALRFVEREKSNEAEQSDTDDPGGTGGHIQLPDWHQDFTTQEMLRRHQTQDSEYICNRGSDTDSGSVSKHGDGFVKSPDQKSEGRGDVESSDNDGLELLYAVDNSEVGQGAYLKALTDTDADINLYLPLRDGDPEELKKSAVVNRTAAAGLECAEDAAFFPHAYNRMSRTPFATRRQKAKAAANLAKRLAEEQASKEKALLESAEAVRRRNQILLSRSRAPEEKAGEPPKVKTPSSTKQLNISVLGKRSRDSASVTKRTAVLPSTGISYGANSLEMSAGAGLFPRQSKKAKVKSGFALFGKNALSAGLTVSKEDVGLNDRWTIVEDQRLLDLVSAYNKNMSLVADALAMSPQAAAGHRLQRGPKRCMDRMRTLAKDAKSTPPVVRASDKDDDAMRRHSKALALASRAVAVSPPSWVRPADPSGVSELHESHMKVLNDVSSLGAARFPKGPPTEVATSGLVHAPSYHRPGFESADCTPQALSRKRRPFMRGRAGSERRQIVAGTSNQRSTPPALLAFEKSGFRTSAVKRGSGVLNQAASGTVGKAPLYGGAQGLALSRPFTSTGTRTGNRLGQLSLPSARGHSGFAKQVPSASLAPAVTGGVRGFATNGKVQSMKAQSSQGHIVHPPSSAVGLASVPSTVPVPLAVAPSVLDHVGGVSSTEPVSNPVGQPINSSTTSAAVGPVPGSFSAVNHHVVPGQIARPSPSLQHPVAAAAARSAVAAGAQVIGSSLCGPVSSNPPTAQANGAASSNSSLAFVGVVGDRPDAQANGSQAMSKNGSSANA